VTESSGVTSRDLVPRWLRNLLRSIAVAMAAVHSVVAVMQQSMNEDGINYLDMGDAYLRGDWDAALNGVWSPIYGLLIAAVVRISDASIWWEFPTVQITNFAIYILALLSFEFFWTRLTLRYYGDHADREGCVLFPPAAWLALGYSLFIWSSLDLIQVWSVTPDMCVAAIAYLAAGLMLKISAEPDDSRRFAMLGLLLGFGYLVKAALLPLGIVALVLAALTRAGSPGRRARNFLLSFAAMLLVAGPLLGALSWSAGQLTMGDVGRFTYLKHVNEMPYPDFHAAVERLQGSPVTPPRRVFDEPPIYEFAEPVAGTYPMAYDPGHWTAGLTPVISAQGQARALITSAMFYFDLFLRRQGGFLALVLLLGILSVRRGFRPLPIDGAAMLVLWSLAAFAMYSVVHALPRYIAPFVTLFWAGLLAGMRFPPDVSAKKLATVGAVLLTLFVWINLAVLNLDGLRRVTGFTPLAEGAIEPATEVETHAANHPAIADELLQMGLRDGDRIAFIGYSFTEYWARLARLRIVAEIHWHDVDRFWNAPPETQAGAIAAFASTGAVAAIAAPVEMDELPPGWQAVGDTGYLLYMLR
jgi:hypothetical protein